MEEFHSEVKYGSWRKIIDHDYYLMEFRCCLDLGHGMTFFFSQGIKFDKNRMF